MNGEFGEEELLARMKNRNLSHAIAETLFSFSQLVISDRCPFFWLHC